MNKAPKKILDFSVKFTGIICMGSIAICLGLLGIRAFKYIFGIKPDKK
jgi:hypothetical protein